MSQEGKLVKQFSFNFSFLVLQSRIIMRRCYKRHKLAQEVTRELLGLGCLQEALYPSQRIKLQSLLRIFTKREKEATLFLDLPALCSELLLLQNKKLLMGDRRSDGQTLLSDCRLGCISFTSFSIKIK